MNAKATSTLVTVALGLSIAGCAVFDESLYQPRLVEAPSNLCTEAPELIFPGGPQSLDFEVDTREAQDTARDALCTGFTQGGPDVFFGIDAQRGERWHFHVRVVDARADPSIYVTRDCDTRNCDGIDLCGPGFDEHFTFVAPQSAEFEVGIDTKGDEGFEARVEAYRTVCGNGVQEHGETCDDGNDDDLDGCSNDCRRNLFPPAASAVEVNDDVWSANHIRMDAGETIDVTGRVANLCGVDVFAVDVPQGGEIRAVLSGGEGAACPVLADGVTLELLEIGASNETIVRGEGLLDDEVDPLCPRIEDRSFARNLRAGLYFLRVRQTRDDVRPWDYRLRVEVVAGD